MSEQILTETDKEEIKQKLIRQRELSIQIKKLETEKKDINKTVLSIIDQIGKDKIITYNGNFKITASKVTTEREYVNLKDMPEEWKTQLINEGLITKKPSTFLRISEVEIKEDR